MHVALIRTPMVHPYYHLTSNRPIPDLGTAYLQSSLLKVGIDCTLIDAAGEGINNFRRLKNTPLVVNGITIYQIIELIPSDVSIICLSLMHTNRWVYDRLIIKEIRKYFPQIPIIVGGEHATGSYDQVLSSTEEVDYCILGEGDHTLVELVQAINDDSSTHAIEGIAYRSTDGQIICTDRRQRIDSLDDLPFPSWDGVPLENYFKSKSSIASFSDRSIPMIATRGCPHACTFCTCNNMWQSKWRARTPQNVIDEINELYQNYRIDHIDFVDLTFAQSRKWTKEFCELLIAQNLPITWSLPIGTRTEQLDQDILQLMKRAGLERILYSPESGSNKTLSKINKKLDLRRFKKIVRSTVKSKIILKFALIIGFPEQTLVDVLKTHLFAIKAAFWGINDVVCLGFVPYPGTELFHKLSEKQKEAIDYINFPINNDLKNMTSYSSHIPTFLMPIISLSIMMSFYGVQYLLRPWRFIQMVNRVFIAKYPLTTLETIFYYFFERRRVFVESEEIIFEDT